MAWDNGAVIVTQVIILTYSVQWLRIHKGPNIALRVYLRYRPYNTIVGGTIASQVRGRQIQIRFMASVWLPVVTHASVTANKLDLHDL